MRSAIPSEMHRKRKGISDRQAYLPVHYRVKISATGCLLARCVAKRPSIVIASLVATFARNAAAASA